MNDKVNMSELKGILFDYGHTLVWFPRYERIHLVAARNVQKKLKDLGASVEASKIRALIEGFAHRRDGTVAKVDEEFKEILSILEVENYSQDDLQEIIQVHWWPYIQDAHARKGVEHLLGHLKARRFTLGIVANIWSGGMDPALEKLGLGKFFDATVASVDVGFQKPDLRIFKLSSRSTRTRSRADCYGWRQPSSRHKGSRRFGDGHCSAIARP